MRRRYSLRSINVKSYYSYREISFLLKIHVRTIQRWRRQGLKILDTSVRPYLVWGADLRAFLQNPSKTKLKGNELFCVRCRAGRTGIPGSVKFTETGSPLGYNVKQVIITAICEKCGTSISRFSSDRKVVDFKNSQATSVERDQRLSYTSTPSLMTDIRGDRNV